MGKKKKSNAELNEEFSVTACNAQNLTVEKLTALLPKKSRMKITQEQVDDALTVEKTCGIHQEAFEEKLCSYMHIIGPGIGFDKLANAIKFCTLREICNTQEEAYSIVFPEKAKEKEEQGLNCSSFASMYAATKAVMEVQKLSLLPIRFTQAPVAHQMLKKLVDLSNGIGARDGDYVSPTVQMNSAIAAYDIVKMPEELTLNVKNEVNDAEIDSRNNMAEALMANAQAMRQQMLMGKSIGDVQKLGASVFVEDVEVLDE